MHACWWWLLSDPDCVGEIETVHDMMRERGVTLAEHWEGTEAVSAGSVDDDPFALSSAHVAPRKRADEVADAGLELRTLLEIRGPSLSCAGGLSNQRSGAW